MDRKKIGERLKALRIEKAITQEQLAQAVHVSERTVSRWETGSNLPDLSVLVALADFYQVDIQTLISGESEAEPADTLTQLAQYARKEKRRFSRRFLICTSLIVALAVHIGSYLFYQNYELGRQMFDSSRRMEYTGRRLAKGIDYLEKSLEEAGGHIDQVYLHPFDEAMSAIYIGFGWENVPILAETKQEYSDLLQQLRIWDQTDTALEHAFADAVKMEKITLLKNQLYILADSLQAFRRQYDQMPRWQRYFVNWSQVRQQLTDQVKIPDH